jgi:hypothetical protein
VSRAPITKKVVRNPCVSQESLTVFDDHSLDQQYAFREQLLKFKGFVNFQETSQSFGTTLVTTTPAESRGLVSRPTLFE